MNVAVAVLTFEVIRTRRAWLLEGCLHSLERAGAPFTRVLVDNDSQDGSAELVRAKGGVVAHQLDGVRTDGRGMAEAIRLARAVQPDVIVLSADDMLWRPGFLPRLIDFWEHAPDDVLLCGGLLCDEFPWNAAAGVIRAGGQLALARASVAGGAWSFRAVNAHHVLPIPEELGRADVPVCQRAIATGWRLCEMDLASHPGEWFSTWGNLWQPIRRLDREKWGL